MKSGVMFELCRAKAVGKTRLGLGCRHGLDYFFFLWSGSIRTQC